MATPSALISARVPTEVEKPPQSVDRSKSYLAATVEEYQYLDLHKWQVRAIQNGLQEIEQGKTMYLVDIKKDLGLLNKD